MDNEYVIVNKTAIEKRIEELEKEYILISNKSDRSLSDIEYEREIIGEQRGLATTLSQSTPLIPEIEKAFDAGSERCEFGYGNANDKHDYLSNLKLNI